jgi:hypothetical protein
MRPGRKHAPSPPIAARTDLWGPGSYILVEGTRTDLNPTMGTWDFWGS